MLESTKCVKCGDYMKDKVVDRQYCLESIQHHCYKCGYQFESGFRYNSVIKQYIKYVRFHI